MCQQRYIVREVLRPLVHNSRRHSKTISVQQDAVSYGCFPSQSLRQKPKSVQFAFEGKGKFITVAGLDGVDFDLDVAQFCPVPTLYRVVMDKLFLLG